MPLPTHPRLRTRSASERFGAYRPGHRRVGVHDAIERLRADVTTLDAKGHALGAEVSRRIGAINADVAALAKVALALHAGLTGGAK